VDTPLTPRELDIMKVLWTRGPSTVAEVQEALEDDLAYTTVLTMLRLMERKGHVSRTREGRADRYAAEVERQAAVRSVIGRVTEGLLGGSPEELMLRLVDESLDADQLRRLRDVLDERLGAMEGRP
jgi:predicted transcriptional regulator